MFVESLDWLYRAAYKFYLTAGEGRIDREIAHERTLRILDWLAAYLPENYGQLLEYDSLILEYEHGNQKYVRRVGLAAGLNKTGEFLKYSKNFGAAFDTIGAVTKDAFAGAIRPRIVADKNGLGLVNWMKLPNPGRLVVAKTLKKVGGVDREKLKIVVNTAVSEKSIEQDRVIEDFGDVNRFFLGQDIDVLEANFGHLATAGYQSRVASSEVFLEVMRQALEFNQTGVIKPKILAAKLSMDTPDKLLISEVRSALLLGVDQINIGNTTRNPQIFKQLELYAPDQGGGYCGSLALPLVLEKIEKVRELCMEHDKTLVISAGVDDWQSAVRAHVAGADLIQCLHGLVMPRTGGSGFFYRMNRGVARFCQEMGLGNVSDLKGQRWVLEYLKVKNLGYDIDENFN